MRQSYTAGAQAVICSVMAQVGGMKLKKGRNGVCMHGRLVADRSAVCFRGSQQYC